MRVLFMGSPAPVIPVISKLIELDQSRKIEFAGVISQPPRPAGRKRLLTDPPVAVFSKEAGLVTWQPVRASSEEFLNELAKIKPDVIITAAYGQILSDNFIASANRAVINIHPSILPKYRGATPIQAALLNGDSETGVTILFTVKKLDAGNIISIHNSDIEELETAESLLERMFKIGADGITEALEKLGNSEFAGEPQDETKVTQCAKFSKSDGEIDWNQSAATILNRYQAFTPWPGIFTSLAGERISITKLDPISTEPSQNINGAFWFDKPTNLIMVQTADGVIRISELKPAGKKAMDAAAFINGFARKYSAKTFGGLSS